MINRAIKGKRVICVGYNADVPYGSIGTISEVATVGGRSVYSDPLKKMIFVEWDGHPAVAVFKWELEYTGKNTEMAAALCKSNKQLSEPLVLSKTGNNSSSDGVVIFPSSKNLGSYQLQRFNKDGFLDKGNQFSQIFDAILEALNSGYTIQNQALLEQAFLQRSFNTEGVSNANHACL